MQLRIRLRVKQLSIKSDFIVLHYEKAMWINHEFHAIWNFLFVNVKNGIACIETAR